MRLCIATPLTAPDIGGPATYTAFLQKHASAIGVTLTTVSFRDVRSLPKYIRHVLYFMKLLWHGKSCDVIYALDTVSVGFPALIASIMLRKPFLLRVPGDYAWEQGRQRFGLTETLDEYLVPEVRPRSVRPWSVRMLASIQAYVARRAVRVVVPSEYLRNVVMMWGVPNEKIIRIYSALKVIPVVEKKEDLRAEFKYEGFVVATAGRLVPWKGVDELIAAIQILRTQGMHVRLEIFGEGPEETHLKNHVHELNLESLVTFHGSVDRGALGRRLVASDVFVLNTSYEGLSHQILEVMNLGTPVVTTPVGGNPELICDGVEGLFVPVNDTTALAAALARVGGDEVLRDTLIENARKRVCGFHEDVVIREFAALLKTFVCT